MLMCLGSPSSEVNGIVPSLGVCFHMWGLSLPLCQVTISKNGIFNSCLQSPTCLSMSFFLSSVAPCLGWLELSYSLISSRETFLTVQEPEERFLFQPPSHCPQCTHSMLKPWSFGKFFAPAELYFQFYCAIKIFKHFETCISCSHILLVLAIFFMSLFLSYSAFISCTYPEIVLSSKKKIALSYNKR